MVLKKFRNKIDKKYLPYLMLVFGFVVFTGVAVDQLYLSGRNEETDEVTQFSKISSNSNEGISEEIAGVQDESEEEVQFITPTSSNTKQITPTVKPEVKSDTDSKMDNQNSTSHTNTVLEERVVVVVTATPIPTSTPTSIPSPSPTPTPDTRPFEASYTRDGNKVIITANKIIADCRYSSSSPSGNMEISGSSNIANGTNTCEVTLLNTGWSYEVTVKDEIGETKTFRGTV